MAYAYNDGLKPAGRRPRLYLAKGGEVKKFAGENIPGFCAVATAKYQKNGKWSCTDYSLDLAAGVRTLHFLSPMHGTWGDDLGSWGEVIERLGIPIDVAQKIVRNEYPRTAERLDKLEAFAIEGEAKGGDTEVVVISFGSPTNRAIADGYWEKEKSSQTADGRIVSVVPGKDEHGTTWYRPVVVTPEGSSVLSSRHRPGMHGGYWTIEVAVPSADISATVVPVSEVTPIPATGSPSEESLAALREKFSK